jgi:hypothetical protein
MAYTASGTLPMTLFSALVCLALVACGGAADEAEAQTTPSQPPPSAGTGLALPATELTDIARPFGTRHEALADGVPLSYDWALASRLGRGNQVPSGYGALTGWGQVFWAAGSSSATAASQAVEIRGAQTFLCSGAGRQWQRVQQGGIEGAAFRADFAGNDNVPAQITPLARGEVRVAFPAGRAFHYWPAQGRAALAGNEAVCGVMVVFQARVVAADGSPLPAGVAPALLIGGGADYWASTTAPWNQYQTNQDVGIGQLRRLGTQWRWYGLSTAAAADLQRLQQEGFSDRVPR